MSRLLAPGAGALLLALGVVVPWLAGPAVVSLVSLWLLHCAVALSWDIVGSRGDVSLGHSAFFGLGAYALAITVTYGWPFPAGLAAAVLAPALLAGLASIALVRLRGVAFALATLALPALLHVIVRFAPGLNGGGALLLSFTLGADVIHWGTLMAVAWAAWMHARLTGGGPRRSRREALIVSALPTGLAGALFALGAGAVGPELLLAVALAPVTMAVVGGMGTLVGPILGAAIVTTIAEALRPVGVLAVLLAEGALLLFAALVFPGGLVRAWSGDARRLPYNRPTHAPDD